MDADSYSRRAYIRLHPELRTHQLYFLKSPNFPSPDIKVIVLGYLLLLLNSGGHLSLLQRLFSVLVLRVAMVGWFPSSMDVLVNRLGCDDIYLLEVLLGFILLSVTF